MSKYLYINNLQEGLELLSLEQNNVILTNTPLLIGVYGTKATLIILKILQSEFSNIVEKVIVDVGSDFAAYISILKLKDNSIEYKIDAKFSENFCNN